MRELECEDDFPDAGEIDRADSDESDEDFEVSSSRKGRGRGKRVMRVMTYIFSILFWKG